MKKIVLIVSALVSISLIFNSCQNKKDRKEQYENSGFKFTYNKFAYTELNPTDFSWKFLKEFDKQGYFVLNVKQKTLVISNDEGDELFKFKQIERNENGYISVTEKNNVLIITPDYNRIAIGKTNSNRFMMFILQDKDMIKLAQELKSIYNKINKDI